MLTNRNITFATINVNSLNMSSTGQHYQTAKIYAIAKIGTDIIFCSDIRLTNRAGVSAIQDVRNTFLVNPYTQYKLEYNSTRNKRGVGILIKNNLNLSEIARYTDQDENILLLLLQDPTGNKLIVGSIYGPNSYDPDFFTNLSSGLNRLDQGTGNTPIILGGTGIVLTLRKT